MKVRTDIKPELSGIAGLNPFYFHNSASRLQMFCSHLGQTLGTKGATIKYLQSGIERELAKYTFNIKTPCNAAIISIIQKYPKSLDIENIAFNPLTIVVFENLDSPKHEIDIIEIPMYHKIHQYYGFKYQFKNTHPLYPGATVPVDTIIADSPLVTHNGDYKYGLETNVAMMSIPQIAEDGLVISESYANRLTTQGFGSRVISFGKKYFPINLEGYGTSEYPSPFPNIGDIIRPDGLISCLREYNDLLAPVEMTHKATNTPNYNYDKLTYVEQDAQGVAEVIDVIVHKGQVSKSMLPLGMPAYVDKYYNKTINYHKDILKVYYKLKKEFGDNLNISPNFQRLIVESMSVININGDRESIDNNNSKIYPVYKGVFIDEWRIEIIYAYSLPARIGSKLTDTAGGKGVVVDIWPDYKMPVDKFGKRAELISSDLATINRMNISRLYEQYFNALGVYLTTIKLPELLNNKTNEDIEKAWDCWMHFCKTISLPHYEAVYESGIDNDKLSHLEIVIRDGHHLWIPTDNPCSCIEAVREFNTVYPDLIGAVDYIGSNGNKIHTKGNVLIGSMYILLLEKTGGTWSSVSSSKLSHFGNPSKLTDSDKHATPGKQQPIRFLGESEIRLLSAACGGDVVADIYDQSNNPKVHREVIESILRNPKPFMIKRIIDREVYPVGAGKMHSMVKHILFCQGIKFVKGE